VASNLHKVNIPVTVDSRGVDAGIARIQGKMQGLQNKLAKMQPAGGAGGSLKASQGTAFLGGVGKLGPAAGLLSGMGGAGAALAAPAALAMLARAHVEAMATMTKGAADAFASFKQTGEQTFAVNSAVLKVLAETEKSAQAAAAVPGYLESFRIGGAAVQDQGGAGILEQISTGISQGMAAAGAFMSGGTFRESGIAALMVTANEQQAKALSEELRQAGQDRMAGNVSAMDMMMGNFNLRLEQLAIMLGKMGT
jgi:hypothetical protein